MLKSEWVIGIDEVGRGALAGPVVLGAVFLMPQAEKAIKKLLPLLKDSKKLSPKQRETWFRHIKRLTHAGMLTYSVARMSSGGIDRVNIARAANISAGRAFQTLIKKNKRARKASILLDGGLYIDKKVLVTAGYGYIPRTIIGGDDRIPVIQLASIVAKVLRDRYMVRLSNIYPKYGFQIHKGYGTLAHRRAIKKHGVSSVHRKSFCSSYI